MARYAYQEVVPKSQVVLDMHLAIHKEATQGTSLSLRAVQEPDVALLQRQQYALIACLLNRYRYVVLDDVAVPEVHPVQKSLIPDGPEPVAV